MSRVVPFFTLIRIHNLMIAMLVIIESAYLLGDAISFKTFFLIITILSFMAFGYITNDILDQKCSIRFQTTFLPVKDGAKAALEFATETYNYNTLDPSAWINRGQFHRIQNNLYNLRQIQRLAFGSPWRNSLGPSG